MFPGVTSEIKSYFWTLTDKSCFTQEQDVWVCTLPLCDCAVVPAGRLSDTSENLFSVLCFPPRSALLWETPKSEYVSQTLRSSSCSSSQNYSQDCLASVLCYPLLSVYEHCYPLKVEPHLEELRHLVIASVPPFTSTGPPPIIM